MESYACFIPKLVRKEIINPYMDTRDSKRKSFSGQACHCTEFDAAVMMADMSGFTGEHRLLMPSFQISQS